MTSAWKDPLSRFIWNMFDALDENGYAPYVLDIREHVANFVCVNTYITVPEWIFPGEETPLEDREVLQVFWSFLIESFGCCGVSARSGWIEDREAALDFLDYGIAVSGLLFPHGYDPNEEEYEQKTTQLTFDDWKAAKEKTKDD